MVLALTALPRLSNRAVEDAHKEEDVGEKDSVCRHAVIGAVCEVRVARTNGVCFRAGRTRINFNPHLKATMPLKTELIMKKTKRIMDETNERTLAALREGGHEMVSNTSGLDALNSLQRTTARMSG